MAGSSKANKAGMHKSNKVIKMYNKKGIQYNPGSPNPKTGNPAKQVRKRK